MYSDPSLTSYDVNSRDIWSIFDPYSLYKAKKLPQKQDNLMRYQQLSYAY